MRSPERVLVTLLLACALTAHAAEPGAGPSAQAASALAAAPAASSAPPWSHEQVREAAAAVHHHPLLNRLELRRELRFKRSDDAAPPAQDAGWWRELVDWLAETSRWLMWLLGATAAAVLLVRLRGWWQERDVAASAAPLVLPSHVRELDIRPQSLPDDVAAAVRALWAAGRSREALSLLYRGALSRLVHEHAVPVRAASTEGECLLLAQRHLPAAGGEFMARLVRLWQAAVYGAHAPQAALVLQLCDGFETNLPRRTAPSGGTGEAPR